MMEDEPEAEAAGDKEAKDKEAKDKEGDVKMMTKKEKKKRTVKSDLTVKVLTSQTANSAADVTGYFEREAAMVAQDRVIAETNDAKNSLESYILETRSKLDSELKEFILPADNEKFCKTLMEMEDWLMDEEGSQKSEYKKRLAELEKTGGPVERRKREFDRREEFCREFRTNLGKWTKLAESKEEKYAHIPAEERKGVTDCIAAAEQWLLEQLKAQSAMPKHQEPLLVSREVLQKKIAEVVKTCTPIMNKPKPKPPKKEEKKDVKDKKDEKEAGADQGAGDKPADAAADADASSAETAKDGEADSKPSKMEEAD